MEENSLNFETLKKGSKNYNLKYKIILIGDSCVGKSSICLKQTKNTFINEYISTNNFVNYDVDVKYRNLKIKLKLFDTSGKEEFESLISSLFLNSSMVIIVYSIDV